MPFDIDMPPVGTASSLPLVSVLLITYNQLAYVRQALDSILMQRGPFELEIVVGNDCSTDGTGAIIEEYAAHHKGIFHLLSQDKNLGMSSNINRCLPACRGKYVAILEGDDYWADAQKLARQVAFLEANADYSFCFHNAMVLYEDGSGKASHPMTGESKLEYTLDDITRGWSIATASVMYRNGLLNELPEWVYEGTAADLPIFAILANKGRVACLPQTMSVYRINPGGVSRAGQRESYMLGIVRMHKNVDKYLNFRYRRNFIAKLAEDYFILTGLTLSAEERPQALRYLLQALRFQLADGKMPTVNNIKTLIAILLPGLMRRFGHGSRAQATAKKAE